MSGVAFRRVSRICFAAVVVAVAAAAFVRGNYLLGPATGIAYAVITLALCWLVSRARTRSGVISTPQMTLAVAIALPVGYGMAFPASINRDVQYFIDRQATDRRVRSELAAVLSSDSAYNDLAVSSLQSKCVLITISGALPSRAALVRLRSRIIDECPAIGQCLLRWEVTLQDTGLRIDGADSDLFPNSQHDA